MPAFTISWLCNNGKMFPLKVISPDFIFTIPAFRPCYNRFYLAMIFCNLKKFKIFKVNDRVGR